MEKELQVFTNEEFGQVRIVTKDDNVYFVGKDVAEILGYKDTADALKRHVDSEDKVLVKVGEIPTLKTSNFGAYIINESGLYGLILSSKLPNAKKFKHWVTSDVLPSIRKHGAYMTTEVIEKTLSDPDFIIKLATQLKEEKIKNKQLSVENEALASDILKWADTSIINALVRKYGASLGENWGIAWTNFKKELLYKYSINLNSRITAYLNTSGKKTKPKTLDMLNGKEELTNALKTALAMCKERKIDTYDILGKHIGDIDIE